VSEKTPNKSDNMDNEKKICQRLDTIALFLQIAGFFIIGYVLGIAATVGLLLIFWGSTLDACRRLEKVGIKDIWLKL
jgi:hypothetical protein